MERRKRSKLNLFLVVAVLNGSCAALCACPHDLISFCRDLIAATYTPTPIARHRDTRHEMRLMKRNA